MNMNFKPPNFWQKKENEDSIKQYYMINVESFPNIISKGSEAFNRRLETSSGLRGNRSLNKEKILSNVDKINNIQNLKDCSNASLLKNSPEDKRDSIINTLKISQSTETDKKNFYVTNNTMERKISDIKKNNVGTKTDRDNIYTSNSNTKGAILDNYNKTNKTNTTNNTYKIVSNNKNKSNNKYDFSDNNNLHCYANKHNPNYNNIEKSYCEEDYGIKDYDHSQSQVHNLSINKVNIQGQEYLFGTTKNNYNYNNNTNNSNKINISKDDLLDTQEHIYLNTSPNNIPYKNTKNGIKSNTHNNTNKRYNPLKNEYFINNNYSNIMIYSNNDSSKKDSKLNKDQSNYNLTSVQDYPISILNSNIGNIRNQSINIINNNITNINISEMYPFKNSMKNKRLLNLNSKYHSPRTEKSSKIKSMFNSNPSNTNLFSNKNNNSKSNSNIINPYINSPDYYKQNLYNIHLKVNSLKKHGLLNNIKKIDIMSDFENKLRRELENIRKKKFKISEPKIEIFNKDEAKQAFSDASTYEEYKSGLLNASSSLKRKLKLAPIGKSKASNLEVLSENLFYHEKKRKRDIVLKEKEKKEKNEKINKINEIHEDKLVGIKNENKEELDLNEKKNTKGNN